jgi:diguanylate cyclase (GGDEF)-like protein/PAS domain S-box-containing protein
MIFNVENKENYFKDLASLPVPIVVADVESRLILYVNEEAQKLWQQSADKLIGKPQTILHSAYWNERGRETFTKDIQKLLNGGTSVGVRNSALCADGTEIPIEISAIMVKIEDKTALVGTFISIEKREKAYCLVQSKEQELEAILENSQVGVMYLKGGRFLAKSNKKLAEILGYDSIDEMQGISMEQLHLSKERYIWFGKYHYDTLRLNQSTHIQYKLKKKNGDAVWVSLSGKAIDTHVPADLDKGVIWIIDDISDYKNLEETLQSNNNRLNNLLDNINGISWEFNLLTNRFTYVSANMKRILGYEQSEWTTLDSWAGMIYPEDREKTTSYCMIETQKGKNHLMEYRMVKKDGSVIWVLDIVTLAKDKDANPITLFGFILDITKSKLNQLQIEHEQKYLQSIIDGIHDSIMVIKADYTIEVMNKTLKDSIDSNIVEDCSQPKCYEILHKRTTPCDTDEYLCPLRDVMQSKKYTKVVHTHKNEKGTDCFIELGATPLLDDNDECIGIIESARDITEHLETLNELQIKSTLLDFQAHHDSLTGLPNRTLYQDRIERAIQKAKRSQKYFMLLFIDLDHFKEVNDSLGHDVGDEVLLEVSKRLSQCIRAEDTLARLGGDEFTILLEDIEKIQDVSIVAQKILHIFKEPFIEGKHKLYLSCSIGISIYPDDGIEANDLLKYADNAMYKAKSEGRDNFQFYTREMTEIAFERIMLESNIRQAIINDEFVVYYQPQYNGKTNELIGMEALIRWKHPTMGIISPSKFIPLAEESGLIIEIDTWVMKKAMQEFKTWYEMGLSPGVLSLNLSIKQLESSSYLDKLQEMLKQIEFNSHWLKLEILERDVMHNPHDNVLKLNMLHNLGIQLAIDDFGTGQSSLTYLKRFPLDQLKIDQSFVKDIKLDEEGDAIVLAVIALAKALKLDIIAEGVETKEQLEFLLKNGCENIQGFYFSHPLEKGEMEKLLQKKKD